MMDKSQKEKLCNAQSLEEVETILAGSEGIDAKRAYEEIQRHRSDSATRLELDELEAVSGGADRDWLKDGCAATCDAHSWCWSNDACVVWDVTYDGLWETCPDGHEHMFAMGNICERCGYSKV